MRKTLEATGKQLSEDERQLIRLCHPLWEYAKKWSEPDYLEEIRLYCVNGRACIDIATGERR